MRPTFRHFAATAILLGGTLAAARLTDQRRPELPARPLSSIPAAIDGWTGTDAAALDERTLAVLRPTTYLNRTYLKGRDEAHLFIAYYAEQRAGESMHSPKNCLPGSGWEIWNYGSIAVPAGGQTVKINRYSIQNNGTRLVVLYWYQSKQRIIASEYLGKILLIEDALFQGTTAGSLVRITVADQPESVEAGVRLASSVIPEVQHCLGR